MDHWGDPWADNADDKSPAKNAVTSPLPPAFAFNSVPLNGFVDDAGWGNADDDGFGDWTSPNTDNVASTDVLSARAEDRGPGSAGWSTVTHEERDISAKWPDSVSNTPPGLEKVDSEPSDSSTVAQLDEAVDQGTAEEPNLQPQTDVESSVHSSTSPSETSRNDLPVESPRTSVEDERIAGKDEIEPLPIAADLGTVAGKNHGTTSEAEEDEEDEEGEGEGEEVIEDLKAVVTTKEQTVPSHDTDDRSIHSLNDQEASSANAGSTNTVDDVPTANVAQSLTHAAAVVHDQTLLAQLFPTSEQSSKQLDEHDDPIFSTSARKAWYRLTRKQTLREFNHGDNDDNYIRVNWTNSRVRSDVHKTVARWAREDRISGTGPGARASFYWDTPAPAEPTASFGHSRTQSSIPTTKTALPARQSLPPLATNSSAAFDWSSPASADPWKIESPAPLPSPTPPALKNPIVAKLQRQEGRAVSVDLTARQSEQSTHKRTLTTSHTAPHALIIPPSSSAPPSQTSPKIPESQTGLDVLDSSQTSTNGAVDPPVEDEDDEWGEMVQTPTLPTPQQLNPFTQTSTTSMIPSPSSSPASGLPAELPLQASTAEATIPTPIVRLRSTISPTSALFKANAFVPLDAEQGPIGPGMLRPTNRLVQSPADSQLTANVAGDVAAKVHAAKDETSSINGILASSSPVSAPLVADPEVNGKTLAEMQVAVDPAVSVQPPTDSWAEADFSFFESARTATVSQPPSQRHDPSDPFAFFDSTPPTVTQSAAKTLSQPLPRDPTPPALQPPINTISSSERQRLVENRALQDILDGLPDLSYMLKR
ncbi:hypothetical protein B5807_08835 [Epicoccum nigrum]|uniref:Uncharacterized protein n=1 Tax=Epicoccum nigrum TaxID=105696 RepID=A0A1Y2LSS8_EPING|nr:hypothetical protein B5807_08835 [Epicoccum nigrum]